MKTPKKMTCEQKIAQAIDKATREAFSFGTDFGFAKGVDYAAATKKKEEMMH